MKPSNGLGLRRLESQTRKTGYTRTERPHMLACATKVAEGLVGLAKRKEQSRHRTISRSLWLNLQVQALDELAACYNHTGAVGPQRDVEQQLAEILASQGKETGLGALERQTRVLDIKNRNLNLLFNDYRFEDAYVAAEDLVSRRLEMVGEESEDKLLGEMLGSLGQACAFMGRVEPEWNREAEKAFMKSLRHFPSGSRQEAMSKSFLVTVLWQRECLSDASAWLLDTENTASSEEDLVSRICERLLLEDPEQHAFEVVNSLRILSRLLVGKENRTLDIKRFYFTLQGVANRVGTDHPYEQWWKWLGILQLLSGELTEAEICFRKGEALCYQHAFTMRTIGSSILLLRVVLAGAREDSEAQVSLQQRYRSLISQLRKQSAGFDEYIEHFPSIAAADLPAKILAEKSEEFWRLCTYLPFAYA